MATERLAQLPEGRLLYRLKRRWQNGTSAAAERQPRNYRWAELMKRVFAIDVLSCERCGGRLRIIANIHPPDATQKTLARYPLMATEPVSYVIGVAALLSTGLLACYLPARSATRVDPARTLRAE